MKVGFGKAVITPPVGTSLVGYFNDRRSIGVRDELYAVAGLFEDGRNVFALVTCDLVWIEQDTVQEVKEILRQKLKVPVTNILIHATHTHTGPLVTRSRRAIFTEGFHVEDSYLEVLPHYIAGSVKAAWENRSEVKAGFGSRRMPGIAFNRRYLMKDGRIVTNPFLQKEDIVRSIGPVDDTLRVMKITDLKGNLKGVLVNFALHPDTIGDNLVSTDWPGFLRQEIEKSYPGVSALVLNGPSGDINHADPFDFQTRSPDVGWKISRKLHTAVTNLLPGIRTSEVSSLRSQKKDISLPFRTFRTEELKRAFSVLKKRIPKDSAQYIIHQSLLNCYRRSRKEKRIPGEIVVCALGNRLALVGLPGELFTQIGLDIRKSSPFPETWIVQNSNGFLGYVPSREAFQQQEKNQRLKPDYDEKSITEAIGINCSYETTPLACSVGTRAGDILEKESVGILNKLRQR